MKIFFRKNKKHFRENANFFENFKTPREKTLRPLPMSLFDINLPLYINAVKTTMIGESWNVFAKRVLVHKHLRIMCENPGRIRPTPLSTPIIELNLAENWFSAKF